MNSGVPSATIAGVPAHSAQFKLRRVLNWFPLGLTYATFYMGRYNFNVVKGDMGRMFHLDKAQMGIIATAGFWTYALSVIFNGPLADRIGGRRAILLGAVGAAAVNLAIGLLFLNGWATKLIVGMSLLYSVNMYFQSFGALSVVKVNAAWFHVRERGIFGGIFGIMISGGYFLAISFGGWILAHFPWYAIFLVPSGAIALLYLVDLVIVRDRPSQAGFRDFNTADASAGDESPVNLTYIAKMVFTNPILVTIAAAEFCTGFVRQGLMLYFTEFLHEVHHVNVGTPLFWWGGFGVTLGGVLGGLLCGWMSDKLFHSRRPPVAFVFYLAQAGSLLLLGYAARPALATFLIGFCCMWIFGVHGMLSGTASMDFGGRKAAATAAGMLDGIQYVAAGFTGYWLGWVLKTYGWDGVPPSAAHQPANGSVWVYCLVPFSLLGAAIMTRVWNARPVPRPAVHEGPRGHDGPAGPPAVLPSAPRPEPEGELVGV
ncbi:MAG TPA: MFS transporter [Candidatus Saccharimonadales bacterium]|nr:MFS transporter [Candidatus Saccharimonadales bacterium]